MKLAKKRATERATTPKIKFGLWMSMGVAASVFALNGCGGSATNMMTTPTDNLPQTSAVTLTVTDAPPAGVTVLSFEVSINSAVLNPGNAQLITSPQRIEVKRLETDSAFLSTMNVPAGTYQSITVNVANPELTVMNNSGAAIGNCANNSVCHLEPAAAGNVTFSASPFPVVLASGSPTGFQVDLNVANLLSNALSVDFNAAGAINVAQLPLAGQPNNDRLADVDDLLGTAENLDAANSKFTLHTMSGDFQIQANGNTQFELEGCAADNFSCIQTGQVVQVDSEVMNGGSFIARKIEAESDEKGDDGNQGENEVEGVIFKIDDATHFEIVVHGELNATSNVALGHPVVVTLSNAQFQVDTNGLNVPTALQGAFEQATDTSQLMPGQEVQIRTSGGNAMGSPITMTTNRIRLREAQFTAMVAGAPVPPNFTVSNLPGLFTSMGVTSIVVQTSNQTNFQGSNGQGGTGLGSLADQNQVSLRGLLFANGANVPTLIVDKVRKR